MITVIIPVYKVEQYLRECVESVRGQTYGDLEILLIDDGSPDNCGAICDEYAQADERVRVLHTENRGLAAARNLGIREARGEYIGFVDSDDRIEPEMYEILLRRIEETGADVCEGSIYKEFRGREIIDAVPEEVFTSDGAIAALILRRLYTCTWNKLYRTKIWEGISFPEGKLFEDTATVYKVFLKADSVAGVSECIYHYRRREDGITLSVNMKNLIDHREAVLGRYEELIKRPEVNKNPELVYKLREQTAYSAAGIWWRMHGLPEEEKDRAYAKEVSQYMREHFSVFGDRGWSKELKVSAFLARSDSRLSFAAGYYLYMLVLKMRGLNL